MGLVSGKGPGGRCLIPRAGRMAQTVVAHGDTAIIEGGCNGRGV